MSEPHTHAHGPQLLPDGRCRFRTWAPERQTVSLRLHGDAVRTVQMTRDERGYFEAVVPGIEPGQRYTYLLDYTLERPDPASRWQPEGVHGPSAVVSGSFNWTDGGWTPPPLAEWVIYELHVGTFSPEGTFDGVIPHLSELRELGVSAIELMPVAQFPGGRNWGYDGVYPFATQSTYGGPDGLRRLVDAAHRAGLAVVLDVVYNHMGPEGNYMEDFGPFLSSAYRTPWGAVPNFDGRWSDEVRRYFIENGIYWTRDCHIDALRLDAVHTIPTLTPRHFWSQFADEVRAAASAAGRTVYLTAESSANDPRTVRPTAAGGFGNDAQWNDNFHDSLHVALTGERAEYYKDFRGLQDFAKAMTEGFVFQGQFSAYWNRQQGARPDGIRSDQLIVFAQNHDQIGNRMVGDRLSTIVGFEQLKLAAAAVMFSPSIPMIFMGEEYAETAIFTFFIDHSDMNVVNAVRKGRPREWPEFQVPGREPPDPYDEKVFYASKLNHGLKESGHHRTLRDFYRELIRMRREHPALKEPSFERTQVGVERDVLTLRRWHGEAQIAVLLNFSAGDASITSSLHGTAGRCLLDSSAARWGGPSKGIEGSDLCAGDAVTLPPHSVTVFESEAGR